MNADDFGLTDGINRAILDLHRSGALSSSTLMAAAPRFTEAAELARQNSSLGVGCHIVLVDGSPVADPAAIRTLLDRSGKSGGVQFRSTLGRFVRDLTMGRIDGAHIEREATAQIQRLRQAGVTVTHVDTHKHTHMFPLVLEAVLRAAKACDVPAIRNPFEPRWSVVATADAGAIRALQVRLLGRFRDRFWKLVRKHGFATTDGCLGVTATGTLQASTLQAILNQLPEGTWELVCHPGYVDEELRATRTRLQGSRETEVAALRKLPDMLACSPAPIQVIHFSQLSELAGSK